MKTLLSRLRGLFGRPRREADLAAEIQIHLDELTDDHRRRGLPLREARAAARRDFGGIDQMKERYRDQRGWPWFDALTQDVGYALRQLRRHPAFTASVVLTLAVGIGANTAIFSIVNGVVLKPLAYRDPSRLVVVHEVASRYPAVPMIPANAMHFREWRDRARTFDELALVGVGSVNLTGTGEPERVAIARASWNLLSMLGVQPQAGRTFVRDEDVAGRDRVVVLSDAFWRARFAADAGVVGRDIMLNDQPFQVIGVLPRAFQFPTLRQLFVLQVARLEPQLWKPFGLRDQEQTWSGDYNFACLGRLRDGVGIAAATADLDGIQAQIDRRLPEHPGLSARLVPLRDQVTSRSRAGLWLLLAAAGAVLLIACVNVASLLLGRATARRRELSIRLALGASSGRLTRQLLTESAVLVAIAGCVGFFIASAGVSAFVAHAPTDLPRISDIHMDARVLAFTVLVSIVTALAAGLVPAWRAAAARDRETGRATHGRATVRLRSALVVAEIGVSSACLLAAGLLLQSFVKLIGVDRGFQSQRVIQAQMNLPPQRFPDLAAIDRFVRALLDGVSALPDVESAGVVGQLPLAGAGANNTLLPVDAPDNQPIVDMRPISPDYFRTLGLGLRAGRNFDARDTQRVAIVSASTATRAWPGQNPIGKHFRLGTRDMPEMEVIGTVNDVLGVSLSAPPSPTVYFPYWQRTFNRGAFSLAVKMRSDSASPAPAIRDVIHRLDPEMPVPAFRPMDDFVDASAAAPRLQMMLVTAFALTALVLASLGTFGVMSQSVSQRTNEIGIRIALGAAPAAVLRGILAEATQLALAGIVLSVPLALATSRVLHGLLFGVDAYDPATAIAVGAVLIATAVLASWPPARRASRVDPLIALRQE
jgi:predicted permease